MQTNAKRTALVCGIGAVSGACLLALAGPALAQQSQATPASTGQPGRTVMQPLAPSANPSLFTQMPSGEDFARLYPRRALGQRVSGLVRMRCAIAAQGRLSDCAILDETSRGQGFAEATLRLAMSFRVQERTAEGRDTAGGRITIPVEWRVAAAQTSQTAAQ
jgi:protein TonB